MTLASQASGGLVDFMLNWKNIVFSLNALFDKQQPHSWAGVRRVSWSRGQSVMMVSEFL